MSWFAQNDPRLAAGLPASSSGTVDPSGNMPMGGSGTLAGMGGAPSGGMLDEGAIQQKIMALLQGKAPNIQTLLSLKPQLEAMGVSLVPNATKDAQGNPTNYDIRLPNGEGIDILKGASRGGEGWQWLVGQRQVPGPGGTLGGMAGGDAGGYQPHNSEAYKFDVKSAMDAIQNSAAARGTLLTGGTLKDLAGHVSGLASHEFGNDFNRFGQLAANGYNASAGNASMYANLGDAQAANQATQGNNWGQAVSNIGGIAAGGVADYYAKKQQQQQPMAR